jgi:hypothetical protein
VNLTRLTTAVVAVSVCAAVLFAGAGTASANDGPICGTGSSSSNVTTCFTVLGAGTFVGEMHATAQVNSSARKLQVCIHHADGGAQCSHETTITPHGVLQAEWNPNHNVDKAGNYCARTWRVDSDGSKHLIGQECVDVH